MGLAFIENRFRCTFIDKNTEHPGGTSGLVVDLCIEFSVRKSPCAALAELYVRSGVQKAGFPEAFHVPGPLFHSSAPFNDKGTIAVFRQKQGAEQTGRTRTDDNRPVRQYPASRIREPVLVPGSRCDIFVLQTPQKRSFLLWTELCIHIHRIHIEKQGLFARIDRMAHDRKVKRTVLYPQCLSDFIFQRSLCISAGKLEL